MTEVVPPVRQSSRRVKIAFAVGVLVIVAIGAALGIKAMVSARPSQTHSVSYSSQVRLPFARLYMPTGIVVDAAGNSYVADNVAGQVWKLAAGANVPTPLPFNDIKSPTGVAVDTAGNLYVTDTGHNRVLKLASGASEPTVLPFSGLDCPMGVAVDTAGDLYVSDYVHGRVLKLAVAAAAPTALPLPG